MPNKRDETCANLKHSREMLAEYEAIFAELVGQGALPDETIKASASLSATVADHCSKMVLCIKTLQAEFELESLKNDLLADANKYRQN